MEDGLAGMKSCLVVGMPRSPLPAGRALLLSECPIPHMEAAVVISQEGMAYDAANALGPTLREPDTQMGRRYAPPELPD
jgi:hypothetical protein